jgi:hypothetical protein
MTTVRLDGLGKLQKNPLTSSEELSKIIYWHAEIQKPSRFPTRRPYYCRDLSGSFLQIREALLACILSPRNKAPTTELISMKLEMLNCVNPSWFWIKFFHLNLLMKQDTSTCLFGHKGIATCFTHFNSSSGPHYLKLNTFLRKIYSINLLRIHKMHILVSCLWYGCIKISNFYKFFSLF